MYGEPHCYCTMISRGLPLNETARGAEDARAKEQLGNLFKAFPPGEPLQKREG